MIKHILKDGTSVDCIDGHVVKVQEAGPLYKLIDGIGRREEDKCIRSETRCIASGVQRSEQ